MTCSSARSVVVEEMQALLQFIESENFHYEKERNELKAQFHSRPQEERNIVKDILTMHSEFDSEVTKVKTIVEDLSQIPTEKTSHTSKAEDLASQIVIMQASLVRKHDILQKFLVQKINYQRLCEEADVQAGQIEAANKNLQYKITEVNNYDKPEIFSKKMKFLNSEVNRLTAKLNDGGVPDFNSAPDDLWEGGVSGLTEREAEYKLKKVQMEIRTLEEEIGQLPKRYVSREVFVKLKSEVEIKKRRVEDLENRLARANEEQRTSAVNVRNRVTEIVTRPQPDRTAVNKEGRVKSSNLLKDIEASLSRVRAIASPIPRINS